MIAATNLQEIEALEKVELLFTEEDMWGLMPEDSLFEDVAAVCYKVLSRQGAMLEELLLDPHRRYPYRAFLALLGAEEAETVHQDRPCTRDQLMTEFFRKTM